MELLVSIISTILAEYRTRKMLRKIKIRSMGIDGGTKEGYKQLLGAYEKAKHQATIRQIYGVLGGRVCQVEFGEKEISVNAVTQGGAQ